MIRQEVQERCGRHSAACDLAARRDLLDRARSLRGRRESLALAIDIGANDVQYQMMCVQQF